jgi:hypothetical protein
VSNDFVTTSCPSNTTLAFQPALKCGCLGPFRGVLAGFVVKSKHGCFLLMLRNLTKEDPPLNTAGNYNRQLHDNGGMSTIVAQMDRF